MFIKSLYIKNYKCFIDKKIDNISVPNGEPGSGLNILIGENGNGKTSILESIDYLTLNSWSVENKLKVSDFNNYHEPIEIVANIDNFQCKSASEFKSTYHFTSNGIEFKAVNRSIKERNKLLSSPFSTHSYFKICSNYINQKDEDKGEVNPLDKIFNNSLIDGDGINVFYFDKNRTRQISNGTFKTTFERILDDLNWRFLKNLDGQNEQRVVESIHNDYFKLIESITNYGVGNKTTNELSDFFNNDLFKKINIEIVDILSPYKNAFYSIREDDGLNQIKIKDLGSGIEIILTLLLLKNIGNASNGKIIYLIDEPEMHLHPKAQEKLLSILVEEAKDKQIFISTHSPYMFKGSIGMGANLLLLNKSNHKVSITNAKENGWGLFGDASPTWGEINWYAYNLATIEFHNELYGFLQAKAIEEEEQNSYENNFDTWLNQKQLLQNKSWIKLVKGVERPPVKRTMQTYIRNMIHHPENTLNSPYTEIELENSISQMIKAISEL